MGFDWGFSKPFHIPTRIQWSKSSVGSDKQKAKDQAQQAYDLQKQQLALQQQQLTDLASKEANIEATRQAALDALIKRKKIGRASTLLTDWQSLGLPNISRKSLYA
ncbi:MAG: hypothetical protein WA066_02750 [Candidatus Omnitrophota bacterium]